MDDNISTDNTLITIPLSEEVLEENNIHSTSMNNTDNHISSIISITVNKDSSTHPSSISSTQEIIRIDDNNKDKDMTTSTERILNPSYKLNLSGTGIISSSTPDPLSNNYSSSIVPTLLFPSFYILPDELMSNILSYLPATDIIHLSRVSHQFHNYTKASSIWFNLFIHDFDLVPQDISTLQWNPYQAYHTRYSQRKKRIAQLTDKKVKEEKESIAENKQLRLGIGLSILNILTWLITPFLLLLIFLILVAVKLDESIDSSWAIIFIPIYIWIGLALLSTFISCYIDRLANKQTIPTLSIWYGQLTKLQWTPPILLMEYIFGDNQKGIIYGWSLMSILLLNIPLLIMKLENIGDNQYTWAMTFIPIWLVTCLLPWGILRCHWCSKNDRDTKIIFLILFITLIIPSLIVLILLSVSLDNNFSLSLTYIFIPFWIINSFIGLLVLCHCGFTVYRVIRVRDREDILFFIAVLFTVTAIVLPPLLTLINLTLRIDNNEIVSWKRIFGPTWFLIILIMLFTWGGACNTWHTYITQPLAEKRQTEPDPFNSREGLDVIQDVYRQQIQNNFRGSVNGVART